MAPFSSENACGQMVDDDNNNSNNLESNPNNNNVEKLSVDDFQGSEENLRAQLVSDQNRRNEQPGWCPAWMLTQYDESTTKINTIDEEVKRLKTVERFRILDDDDGEDPYHDEIIDGLVRMAASMFDVSIAIVDLVDLGRLKILSQHGLGGENKIKFLPRNDCFCSHAIQCVDQVCVIPDAGEDGRFRNHWMVTGETHFRFYAAAALVVDNYKIGTFCILDQTPRPADFFRDQEDQRRLVQLAATTTRILVDRRDKLETQAHVERSMASFSHTIMSPLNGLTLALSALCEEMEHDQTSCDVVEAKEEQEQQSSLQQPNNKNGFPPLPPSPPSKGAAFWTTEQRELLHTASACADELIQLHRRNQDSILGHLAPPIHQDSTNAAARMPTSACTVSDMVANLLERVATIPKQVPVFTEIDDSAVPDTTVVVFSHTQELIVFRAAMACLSTACARSLQGSIVLRILCHSKCPGGEEDDDDDPYNIIFECHDGGPHLSDHDAAEFQCSSSHCQNRDDGTAMSSKEDAAIIIHNEEDEQHNIQDPSLQGLWFALQSVERIHGRYGYRRKCNVMTHYDDDVKQQGSVFWFRIPVPHLPLRQQQPPPPPPEKKSGGSPPPPVCCCPPPATTNANGKDIGEPDEEHPIISMISPMVASTTTETATIVIADKRDDGNNGNHHPLLLLLPHSQVPLVCREHDQASITTTTTTTTTTTVMNLISPKSSSVQHSKIDAAKGMLKQIPQVIRPNDNDDNDRNHDSTKEPLLPLSRPKQALIIDDALIIRKTLARMLTLMGYEVSLAVDGQDGLEQLQAMRYDLVLCDFLMPIMDGADCVRHYRAWEEGQQQQQHRSSSSLKGFRQLIMGMSGHASSLDAEHAMECGMDGFYAKPLTRKILDGMLQTQAAVEAASILDRYWMESGCVSAHIKWSCSSKDDTDIVGVVEQAVLPDSCMMDTEVNDIDRSNTRAFSMDMARRHCPVVCSESIAKLDVTNQRHCLMATNFDMSESFLLAMHRHGWQVCFAENGVKAMDSMKERNWDAVIIGETLCSSSSSSSTTTLPFRPSDIHHWSAARYVTEFRNWERLNRFNRQKNVFLQCTYSAREVGKNDAMGGSITSVLIQPPPGFDGALNIDMQWDDFNRLVSQQNCADQDSQYDPFFVKRRRNVVHTN